MEKLIKKFIANVCRREVREYQEFIRKRILLDRILFYFCLTEEIPLQTSVSCSFLEQKNYYVIFIAKINLVSKFFENFIDKIYKFHSEFSFRTLLGEKISTIETYLNITLKN